VTRAGSGRHSWLHWGLSLATVALLIVVARGVDWEKTWTSIRGADAALLAIAAIANLATLLAKAVRWSMFLNAVGATDLGFAIRATFAGAALNSVVVANGGDAARVAAVSRSAGVSSAAVLGTLAVDRLSDLATYLLLFAVSAFVLPLPEAIARWRLPAAIVLAALVVACIAFALAGRNREPSNSTASASSGFYVRARDYWYRLVATSATIATPRRMTAALALAMLAWGGQWATFHFTARATGLPVTAAVSLLALVVVNASFLVRLTPGNVGVFQLLYALAVTSAGLDRDAAVAAAFLIAAIQYIPVVLIGLPLAPSLLKGRSTEAGTESVREFGRP